MNSTTTKLTGMVTLASIASLSFSSCTSVDLSYFTDVPAEAQYAISQSYNHKIQKADKLVIKISSSSPELVIPFTSTGADVPANTQTSEALTQSTRSAAQTQGDRYTVNAAGNITFPILGTIHAQGLSYPELAKSIQNKLIDGGYITDPTVSVDLDNFKITVLGEVQKPGVQAVESDRVTIFDGLAMAGDMTQYGVREKVSLIRESGSKREVVQLNLSSQDIFNSPYYYLQPNDTLYVQPNNAKAWNSTTNSTVITYTLAGLAAIFSLFNLLDD